jgi:hypothetical protein
MSGLEDHSDPNGHGEKDPRKLSSFRATFASRRRAEVTANDAPSKPPPRLAALKEKPVDEHKPSINGLRSFFQRSNAKKTRRGIGKDSIASPSLPTFSPIDSPASLTTPRTMLTVNSSVSSIPTPTTTSSSPMSSGHQVDRKASRKNLRRLPSEKPKTSKCAPIPSQIWDPPPLFQAYPQAIKYTTLVSSTLSAEQILKLHNSKRSSSVPEDYSYEQLTGLGLFVPGQKGEKAREAERKHKRKMSASLSMAEWTSKIYVLVTSGYLLQYHGDGAFDRLPEKVLPLCKDSVGFASDVIPGKHWVLQVSSHHLQTTGGSEVDENSTLFSKFSFRQSRVRSTAASSFLLIFDSAEELESWMFAVRREIESLGGKVHAPEVGTSPRKDGHELQHRPSRGYLVKRDPDLFNNPLPWENSKDHLPEPDTDRPISNVGTDTASSYSTKRHSSIRPSIDAPSTYTTAASQDQSYLDSLHEGSIRSDRRGSKSTRDHSETRELSPEPIPESNYTNPTPFEGASASTQASRRRSTHGLLHHMTNTMSTETLKAGPKRPHSIQTLSERRSMRSPSIMSSTTNMTTSTNFSKASKASQASYASGTSTSTTRRNRHVEPDEVPALPSPLAAAFSSQMIMPGESFSAETESSEAKRRSKSPGAPDIPERSGRRSSRRPQPFRRETSPTLPPAMPPPNSPLPSIPSVQTHSPTPSLSAVGVGSAGKASSTPSRQPTRGPSKALRHSASSTSYRPNPTTKSPMYSPNAIRPPLSARELQSSSSNGMRNKQIRHSVQATSHIPQKYASTANLSVAMESDADKDMSHRRSMGNMPRQPGPPPRQPLPTLPKDQHPHQDDAPSPLRFTHSRQRSRDSKDLQTPTNLRSRRSIDPQAPRSSHSREGSRDGPLPSGERIFLNVTGEARGALIIGGPPGSGGLGDPEARKLGVRHSFSAMRQGLVKQGGFI